MQAAAVLQRYADTLTSRPALSMASVNFPPAPLCDPAPFSNVENLIVNSLRKPLSGPTESASESVPDESSPDFELLSSSPSSLVGSQDDSPSEGLESGSEYRDTRLNGAVTPKTEDLADMVVDVCFRVLLLLEPFVRLMKWSVFPSDAPEAGPRVSLAPATFPAMPAPAAAPPHVSDFATAPLGLKQAEEAACSPRDHELYDVG